MENKNITSAKKDLVISECPRAENVFYLFRDNGDEVKFRFESGSFTKIHGQLSGLERNKIKEWLTVKK